ncbi:MAG TPA: hypothetical protein VIU11_26170 [Nakamurella sp.]
MDRYGLSAVHPDDFLLDQLDLDTDATVRALRCLRSGYRRPAMTGERFYAALAKFTPAFAVQAESADPRTTDDQPPA